MNQTEIGKFISSMRKEKGLTQRELADKLLISDKTVSKWETGKGLPEVSLMIPLCEELSITVNELLSAQKLSDLEYKRKAEENIMDLMKEKQENKKKVIVAVVVCIVTIFASVTIIMCSGYYQMPDWQRIVLVCIGFAVMAGGLWATAALEWNAGTYECVHCNHRFVPSKGAYIAGMHTLTRRHLKCPHCGKKSWCKRRLTH